MNLSNPADFNLPVDQIHRDSLAVTARIREAVARYREQINAWEPRPTPPEFQ